MLSKTYHIKACVYWDIIYLKLLSFIKKKPKTGQLWSFSRVLPEDMTTESSPETELQVYGVRWYLLSVVSLNCCLQTAVWAEFPPIAQSAKLVYDWSDSDINMSLNYGNIGTIVLLPPMIWIVFTKGKRYQ